MKYPIFQDFGVVRTSILLLQIFCAKCQTKVLGTNNDIILCDGACDRGYHQLCLDPPLLTEDSNIWSTWLIDHSMLQNNLSFMYFFSFCGLQFHLAMRVGYAQDVIVKMTASNLLTTC